MKKTFSICIKIPEKAIWRQWKSSPLVSSVHLDACGRLRILNSSGRSEVFNNECKTSFHPLTATGVDRVENKVALIKTDENEKAALKVRRKSFRKRKFARACDVLEMELRKSRFAGRGMRFFRNSKGFETLLRTWNCRWFFIHHVSSRQQATTESHYLEAVEQSSPERGSQKFLVRVKSDFQLTLFSNSYSSNSVTTKGNVISQMSFHWMSFLRCRNLILCIFVFVT